MTPYSVDTSQQPGLAEIVTSLPHSLVAVGPGTSPQVVALAGGAGWPARAEAALSGGALAVVVLGPIAAPIGPVPDLRHVVVAWDYAANPAVAAAAVAADPLRDTVGLVQAMLTVAPGADVHAGTLDALVTVRRVCGPLTSVESLRDDVDGRTLVGRLASGAALSLSLTVTAAVAPTLRIRLVGTSGLHVVLPSPDTAAPGVVRIQHDAGERQLPTEWVSSRRASWARAAAVAAGEPSPDVAELIEVLAIAAEVSRCLPGVIDVCELRS